MALESGTYISDLNPSNPVGATDKVSTLDDHVRLIKSTLQNTFPNIDGAVTATEDELNHLDGVTGTTGTGKLVLDDAPTIADLTVTDSITLPAASIADAALSDNVPLKNAPNEFSAQVVITGTHATDTRIRRGDTTGLLRLLGGTDASGNTGGHIALFGADVEGARANGADLNAGTGGIVRVQAPSGTVELNADTLDFNGNADISGTLAVGGTITGNGSGLSSLNASNLSSGTVPSARLPATIGGNKTFSDNVTINGAVRAGTAATSTSSTLEAGQIHHRSSNTTVPSMNAGQWVAVQNTSTSSITLSQGSGVTLELGGTTMTGNRTLLPKGFAFIYFRANGIGVVHGSGVT